MNNEDREYERITEREAEGNRREAVRDEGQDDALGEGRSGGEGDWFIGKAGRQKAGRLP